MATGCALPLPDCPPAPARLGPYEVVGLLAGGGMGIVLRGQDLRDGRMVALKMVRSPTSADAASMRREIAALGQLSHPGIVRLIGHGHADGLPWMAMELLDGHTITEAIEALWRTPAERARRSRAGARHSDDLPTMRGRGRPIARRDLAVVRAARPPAAAGRLRDVIGIVAQLCRALDHVHAFGLVHRDVKPANVFLGGDGRVTLLDFGLVCAVAGTPGAEPAEICVGTMEYAAPEQIQGGPVDARADIYSLGCLLYELVTGRRTVDIDSAGRIVERSLPVYPPLSPLSPLSPAPTTTPPSDLVSSLPVELEGLLLAMLARQRDDRPASAGEVAAALAGIAHRLT